VTRISADGTKRTDFDVRKVQGFEKAETYDFDFGLHKNVYLLAATAIDERRILRFSEDGNFESSIRLSASFLPHKLAVMPSGQFLIVGEELDDKSSRTGKPFTALVDASGQTVSQLDLADNIAPTKDKDQQDKNVAAIEPGEATVAEDGNIYVMRASDPPVVHVLDYTGKQIRRFEVPSPGKGFEALVMKVAYGRIIVQFDRKIEKAPGGEQLFEVVDATSGDHIAEYSSPDEIGGTFACYTPNHFLFVGQTNNKLSIQTANP
jgi:hypothetical protein